MSGLPQIERKSKIVVSLATPITRRHRSLLPQRDTSLLNFIAVLSWIMIQWLTLDRLEQLTEQFHQAYAVYFDLIVDTAVSLDELQTVIPVAPVSNPHPSEPGPHECWYGCVDDFPFVITYYHYHSSNCYTAIRIFPSPPSQNRYLWSTLERLIPLPKPLLQRIVWLGYLTLPRNPTHSLYCREDPMWRNPPCEVYRAATAEEAEALLDFLTSLQPEYAYYISEPSHRE